MKNYLQNLSAKNNFFCFVSDSIFRGKCFWLQCDSIFRVIDFNTPVLFCKRNRILHWTSLSKTVYSFCPTSLNSLFKTTLSTDDLFAMWQYSFTEPFLAQMVLSAIWQHSLTESFWPQLLCLQCDNSFHRTVLKTIVCLLSFTAFSTTYLSAI